jgi:DNA alkylation damage repair protein AlkB
MELGDGSEFRNAEKSIRKMILVSKTDKKKRASRKVRGVIGASVDCPFDLSTIVDYRESCTRTKEILIPDSCRVLGMESARVIKIDGAPEGFYIIAGALNTSEQLSLAKIALEEYSTAEHTNLSNLSKLSEDKSRPTDATIQEVINNNSRNIWLETLKDNDNFERFKALRWASLGYHYDWTKRMYQENVKSDFPPKLAALCRRLSGLIGENMVPEAAIVNYYPVGTYMSGHLDDAEHAMEEPIVSISLGTSAIFLLGGRTKNEKPIPILIKSGDVIVMAKDSRYSYHGVPAVLSHSFFETLKSRGSMSPSSSSGLHGCLNRVQHHDNIPASGSGEYDRRHFCCSICQLAATLKERCRNDDSKQELNDAYSTEEGPEECSSSQERSIPYTALPTDTDIDTQADTYADTDMEIDIIRNSLTESSTVIVNDSSTSPDSDPDPGPNTHPDPGPDSDPDPRSDSDPGPVLQYLLQGRININVRRVARPNAQWKDKCGSGASYNP